MKIKIKIERLGHSTSTQPAASSQTIPATLLEDVGTVAKKMINNEI